MTTGQLDERTDLPEHVQLIKSRRRLGVLVHKPHGLRHRLAANDLLVNLDGALELFLGLKVGQRDLLGLYVELGALLFESVDTLIEQLTPLVDLDGLLRELVEDTSGVKAQRAELPYHIGQREVGETFEFVGLAFGQWTLADVVGLDDMFGEWHLGYLANGKGRRRV